MTAAGMIDEGENYEINILKEVKEELGIDLLCFQYLKDSILVADIGIKRFTKRYFARIDIDLKDIKTSRK
ncbi:MAG: hypothetical protein Fur0024_0620 [Patescibacteria group bacterium]